MGLFTGIFAIIMAGIVADTLVKLVKARGGGSDARQLRAEVRQLSQVMEDQGAALADAHAQLQELSERVEFAERLLTRERDRPGLGPGAEPGGTL
ncbi:MAG TPA: hypothetical protein VNH46_07510 [Gemmatimonadales bacterium]|nr:hypothetical protein [Gemmatimonadales bacterium]